MRGMFWTYQVGEVGDARDVLAGDELEGDAGEDEREAELEAVLRQLDADGERRERQRADEELTTDQTDVSVMMRN